MAETGHGQRGWPGPRPRGCRLGVTGAVGGRNDQMSVCKPPPGCSVKGLEEWEQNERMNEVWAVVGGKGPVFSVEREVDEITT